MDTSNIVRWKLDNNYWTFIAGSLNGTIGNRSTLFERPRYAILDPMDNLYVADRGNHRIQFFYAGQSNGIIIVGVT